MSDNETMSDPVESTGSVLDLDSIFASDDSGLLDAPVKQKKLTGVNRLERAFLEIVEFRRSQGRLPDATTREISERKLGARLTGILANDQKIAALKHLDTEFGLLELPEAPESLDDLLGSGDLDLLEDESGLLDLSDLPVQRTANSADSVAMREKCVDFDQFEHLFKAKHAELKDGTAKLADFQGLSTVAAGRFFVLDGVMLFVAEVGEINEKMSRGRVEKKQRLRIIFENGTESAMYKQSLSIRLHEKDGFAVVQSGISTEELLDASDQAGGYIYVLRSKSQDPKIAGIKDLHKIGFTRGSVKKRIQNAEKSPTYLMAPVEVVATYRTYNMRASALEHLLHRVFAPVRLDLTQVGADGREYDPSEWFVVPRSVIDQGIEMIMSGEIMNYLYDPGEGTFSLRDSAL